MNTNKNEAANQWFDDPRIHRLGVGHTVMVEFCGVLGMPAMHLKTFQKKEFNIVRKTLGATENMLKNVAIVPSLHCEVDPDFPTHKRIGTALLKMYRS